MEESCGLLVCVWFAIAALCQYGQPIQLGASATTPACGPGSETWVPSTNCGALGRWSAVVSGGMAVRRKPAPIRNWSNSTGWANLKRGYAKGRAGAMRF